MANSVTAHYAAAVASGRVESDDAQLVVLDMMARLETRIAEYRLARKSSSLGWLFASRQRALPQLKGLYIYGEVGRGKTMLMDFFFETSPVERKRRAHFHEFMLDVHERIHAVRQDMKRGEHEGEDPIRLVADPGVSRLYWFLVPTALMKGRPFGVPYPVTLSQPGSTVSEVSAPKANAANMPSPSGPTATR